MSRSATIVLLGQFPLLGQGKQAFLSDGFGDGSFEVGGYVGWEGLVGRMTCQLAVYVRNREADDLTSGVGSVDLNKRRKGGRLVSDAGSRGGGSLRKGAYFLEIFEHHLHIKGQTE